MQQKKTMIPLRELNLTSRFLFDEVMEDAATQQEALSIILGRDISLLQQIQSEKELRISPLARSIRMDVFSIDEDEIVYNTEMQNRRKGDLVRRSRYYQGILDTSLLEPGILDYNRLNQTYLIMIMTFDLFGLGKYCYTFMPKCLEVPDLSLDDGAVRMFLNTRGRNDSEVSKELTEFLHYLEHTTDAVVEQTESARIRRIHDRVRQVRSDEEIGVKYMQAWEERYYDRQEAREEGLQEGRTEGRIEAKRCMAQRLTKMGLSIEQIAKAAEVDIAVLEQWLKEDTVHRWMEGGSGEEKLEVNIEESDA
nr:Rpn family recombination-promoting nuclease/putative transposase [Parablautia sp. Marseille-Q6255]